MDVTLFWYGKSPTDVNDKGYPSSQENFIFKVPFKFDFVCSSLLVMSNTISVRAH